MEQVSATSAYIWAIIVMAVCLGLAVIISNLINYKPNNPGTVAKRIWFWALCAANVAAGFLINFLIQEKIVVPTQASAYLKAAGIAAGIALVGYIVMGFCISKMFPRTKVGTWF